jgi:3-ketosteroid 9alpha-monooxygenase subunit A
MRGGWHQVAFDRELNEGVNPLAVERRLIAVRRGEKIRIFDAVCPHRGAHLGHGGRLEDEAIVCPFHARRIALGSAAGSGYRIAEHEAFSIGGMVFAHLSGDEGGDVPFILRSIDRDHEFIPGFSMRVPVPAELVIENGFDALHFQPVHSLCTQPSLTVVSEEGGELRVEGVFSVLRSPWQNGPSPVISVPYAARGLSPGLVLSHLGGGNPIYLLTAATPLSPMECTIRLTIAVPAGAGNTASEAARREYVLTQARKGLELDLEIWRNLAPDAPARYAPEDAPVIAFRRYVSRFPVVA